MRVLLLAGLYVVVTGGLAGCCAICPSGPPGGKAGAWHEFGGHVQSGVHQKPYLAQKLDVPSKSGGKGIGGHFLHPPRFEPSGCCGDTWDPILGGGQCGVCGGGCQGHTPAQHLKYLMTCASGCGEIYWGEWISDPPAPCDPCDDWGHWTGPHDCGPTCWEHLASGLRGYRAGCGKGKGKAGVPAAAPYVEQVIEGGEEIPLNEAPRPEPILEEAARTAPAPRTFQLPIFSRRTGH